MDEIPAETLSEWRSVDVKRYPPASSNRPATHVFSVKLPAGWEVDGLRMGADSWGGGLEGEGFTLGVAGGPFAVGELYEIVGGGPSKVDWKLARKHVVTQEENNGIHAILVRPRDGEDGLTGAILSIPGGRMIISRQGLSRDDQAIAFEIIRSITP